MAIIKCKMCGGDMELSADKTLGTCEYCGSTMTVPKVDDQQRAAAFDRGNHFRRLGEFDKALSVYERIVQEDENDAEAHWCCALCRFGIEYVKDPATGEYLPTCHRASFDSFLEDVDYQAALTHADVVARKQYEKDGEQIAAVQRGILSTVQKEEPFDVFICYKESDDKGQRTVDSTLAQDIYYQLTEQGRRVFFARITLEDKAGQEYEPYIFAALHSAKVMVVVGTRPEYLNAVWVKNEWSRYLALMKQDHKRLLIPCFRDMDPYDLPEQLSVLQSYDMGKIGFIQDLIRGIAKVLDADKKPEPVQTVATAPTEGGSNLTALLDRGYMALEDGEFDRADEFFEQALNLDAKCAEAYWGKALAEAQCCNDGEFIKSRLKYDITKREVVACDEDEARIKAAIEKFTVPDYLERFYINRYLSGISRTYASETVSREAALAAEKDYWEENKLLVRVARFAQGEFAARFQKVRNAVFDTLQKEISDSRAKDEREQLRVTEEYERIFAGREEELKIRHQEALEKWEKDRARQEKLEAEQEMRKAEREKRAARLKKLGIIAAIAACIIAILAFVIIKFVIPPCQYKAAENYLTEGDLAQAAIVFNRLGGYKDAKERSFDIWAQAADRQTISAGDYHTVGFRSDGTVAAVGENGDGRCDVAGWSDIAAVSAGSAHTVGLKADGTVIAVGSNMSDQCDISNWSDIVAVSAGGSHTVGLKADGTVVAVGSNTLNQCDVDRWSDVVAVSAGYNHTVGLRMDGTVVAVGYDWSGQCDVSNWSDIVAVSAGGSHTVGLKADGTVVAAGYNDDGRCNISDWGDIVAVSAGGYHTVGLRADGTVVAVGDNEHGQCDVDHWTDIVAIVAGNNYTVGIKKDGTVVAVGDNQYGQCDVTHWTNIKLPE